MMLLLAAAALAGTIEDAIERRFDGDLAGATALLDAYTPTVEETSFYLYERGICAELAHDPATAEALYRRAIAAGSLLDARFRLALVLEDQGRDDEALREVIILARAKGLDEDDQVTLDLQTAISEVRTGKVKQGVRQLEATLAPLEGGNSHAWMRAKARVTLEDVLVDEADRLDLRLPERRQVRRLKRRVADLQAAEAQVTAVAHLDEPEWVLAGLLRLGDGYATLADALAVAPPPHRLTPAEDAVFHDEVRKKAGTLRAKAVHIYRSGVDMAVRIEWESPRVQELRERAAAAWTVPGAPPPVDPAPGLVPPATTEPPSTATTPATTTGTTTATTPTPTSTATTTPTATTTTPSP